MLQFIKQNNRLMAVLSDIEENPHNPDTLEQYTLQEFKTFTIEERGAMEAAMHDIQLEEGLCLPYSR